MLSSGTLRSWVFTAVILQLNYKISVLEASWNVMAHAQKSDFVFQRNGRVHLNRRTRQFSWLLTTEVCASAVVMLDTPCSEVVWRVLATHSIRQFPLHFPSRASPCAITFQLESTPSSVFQERNRYELRTSRKIAVTIPDCVIGILHWFIPSNRSMTLW